MLFRSLARRYPGRLELLPHAAADTEHVSRVHGARQAVDQIFDAIQFKSVTNLKGELPEGYVNMGAATVPCVGKVSQGDLERAVHGDDAMSLRAAAETMAAIWGALLSTTDPLLRRQLIDRHGPKLVMTSNAYGTLMRKLGLEGPYAD